VGEISIHLPGLAEIIRSFDQHGSWPEGLEANNDMREMKLRLEIKAYCNILHSIFSLPPQS